MELFQRQDGKQVGFIQHDDDAESVMTGQFLDMLADAGVKRGKAGVRFQSQADRKLAIVRALTARCSIRYLQKNS